MKPILLIIAFAALAATAYPAVERWDTYEIALPGGTHANPFRDVSLKARFTHEYGKTLDVAGFYDGDATWRIRFMPPDTGRWTYTTTSSDPQLNGKSGDLTCVPPAKPYLHGPLGAKGLHFVNADGRRRFLISTRLSCQFADPSVWPPVVDFLKESRINRVLFIMGGIHNQVKLLFGDEGKDPWRYDVKRFQAIDSFIDMLRKADIQASPYFYYFNDGYQKTLTPEQDEAFLRYGMARIGAYSNVMPVLSNEVEQKYSTRTSDSYDPRNYEWANHLGRIMKSLAVFGVPVSIHNPMENHKAVNPGFFTLLQQWPFEWADFQLRQMQIGSLGAADTIDDTQAEPTDPSYSARAFARQNELLASLRRFKVPVINEEPGYEMERTRPWSSQTSITVRATFWSAALAGAYTIWGNPSTYVTGDPLPQMKQSRTPQYLATLAKVMDTIPYWEMEPANHLIADGAKIIEGKPYRTNFGLAKPNECYLFYTRDGGRLEMQLPPGDYALESIDLIDVPGATPPHKHPAKVKSNGKVQISTDNGEDHALVFRSLGHPRNP